MTRHKVPAAALAVAREAAGRIREIEAEAGRLLHEAGDTAGHRRLLTEKCLVLEELPGEAEEAFCDSTTGGKAAFTSGLEDFARRAAMALQLESIFFMGALLYPEDYRDGDPNDLERFLDRFEAA
jgi:hypothetical protein